MKNGRQQQAEVLANLVEPFLAVHSWGASEVSLQIVVIVVKKIPVRPV